METPALDSHAGALAALAALSHPLRLRVFRQLPADGARGLGTRELADLFGLDLETVNLHLGQLHRAGIVRAARDAGQVVHVRAPGALADLVDYLAGTGHEKTRAVAGAGLGSARGLEA